MPRRQYFTPVGPPVLPLSPSFLHFSRSFYGVSRSLITARPSIVSDVTSDLERVFGGCFVSSCADPSPRCSSLRLPSSYACSYTRESACLRRGEKVRNFSTERIDRTWRKRAREKVKVRDIDGEATGKVVPSLARRVASLIRKIVGLSRVPRIT